jgi:hypothetical protein
LDKKLAGYTLLGAAAFSISGKAHADGITYVPNVDVTVDQSDSTNYYDFNLSGPSAADIIITAYEEDISATVENGAMTYNESGAVAALTYGTLIDPNASPSYWGYGGKMPQEKTVGYWPADGTDAYLGFYFVEAGQDYAGWADISTTVSSTDASFTINSYAYEDDPDAAIMAGQTTDATPEPSTLTLLALGCVGLLEARRRCLKNA